MCKLIWLNLFCSGNLSASKVIFSDICVILIYFFVSSVQRSIQVMDTIAYLKAQAVAQRNASGNNIQPAGCGYETLSNCHINSSYKHRVNPGGTLIPNVQVKHFGILLNPVLIPVCGGLKTYLFHSTNYFKSFGL